jgi:hypothetical protein
MDKHLDGDMLCDYAEGAMAPEARLAAEAHLQGCADCRRELEAVRGYFTNMAGFAALEPEPAPRDFLAKVRARLPQPSPWKTAFGKWLFPWKLVPAQIIGLCMLGVTGLLLYRMKDRVESAPAPVAAIAPAPSPEEPSAKEPAAPPEPEPKAAPAAAPMVTAPVERRAAPARAAKKAADREDAGALAKAAAPKPDDRREIVASQAITSGSQPGAAAADAMEKRETETLTFADREAEAAPPPPASVAPSPSGRWHGAPVRLKSKGAASNAGVTYVLHADPALAGFEAGLDRLGIRWSKREGAYALELPSGGAAGLEKFLSGYGRLEKPGALPAGSGNFKATLRLQAP